MTTSKTSRSEKRAFIAGYLWSNFLFNWDVTEIDMEQARDAYVQWIRHLNSQGETVNVELSDEMQAAVNLGYITKEEAERRMLHG